MGEAARVAAATGMIFVTTSDDAIWLIPHLSSSNSFRTLAIAITFACGLELIILVSWLFQIAFGAAIGRNKVGGMDPDIALGVVGAMSCWAIAIGLYIKKMIKLRRNFTNKRSAAATAKEPQRGSYGTVIQEDQESTAPQVPISHTKKPAEKDPEADPANQRKDSPGIKEETPLLVIFSLALIGSLDEASYFPSLLLAGTFTAWELSLGALIACGLIVLAITSLRSFCGPLIDFFDRIPLYFTVALFATIMTVDVANQLITQGSE